MPSIAYIQPNLARTPEQEENFQKHRQVTGGDGDHASGQMEQAVKALEALNLEDKEEMMGKDSHSTPSTTSDQLPPRLPSSTELTHMLRLMVQSLDKDAEHCQYNLPIPREDCLDHLEHMTRAARRPTIYRRHHAIKLKTFLAQFIAIMSANSSTFLSDTNKETQAAACRESIPFLWYKQQSFPKKYPDWFYNSILLELAIRSSDEELDAADAVHFATRRIKACRMFNKAHIRNYIKKFESLSVDLKWNDAALRDQFRAGLCNRIQESILQMNAPPATLSECVDASIHIDSLYWALPAGHRSPANSSPR